MSNINDLLYDKLGTLGFVGALPDRAYDHLGSLGYTGAMNDRLSLAGGLRTYVEDLLGAGAIVSFGALTRIGAGGFAVSGSTLTSDDSGGQFQIAGGFLSPAQDGVTDGAYNLSTDLGEKIVVSVELNAFTVRTDVELTAIDRVTEVSAGGVSIVIRDGGDFTSNLRFKPLTGFPSSEVVIRGETPTTTISKLWFENANNITVRDLRMYREVGSEILAVISGVTSNIKFLRVAFDGPEPVSEFFGNQPEGIRNISGSTGVGVTNLTVEDCSLKNLSRGMSTRNCRGLTVIGNTFDKMYQDSIAVPVESDTIFSDDVTISGNLFQRSQALATDTLAVNGYDNPHSDYIQIDVGDTVTATFNNYTIANNRFLQQGSRGQGQNIFMSTNGVSAGRLANMTISNNVVVSTVAQGIWLQKVASPNITNNTVIADTDQNIIIPSIRLEQTENATIQNCAYAGLLLDASATGTTLTNNYDFATNDVTEYLTAFEGPSFGNAVVDSAADITRKVGGVLDLAVDIGADVEDLL